jgi:Cu/Ag efflux pump CusA
MVMVKLTLLMIQLQSFSRLFLVFVTAPLGIAGASLGLNVANQPFGFVALLGLIAHHGRFVCGNLPDSSVPAGPLCPVVPQEPGGKRQG